MLSPRFIPESVFYTQSVLLSPRFYTQSVVRSPWFILTGVDTNATTHLLAPYKKQ